jgi:phosphoribosylaminoimidazolecarboxamide formyltransferase/IMP cyclohydrolase
MKKSAAQKKKQLSKKTALLSVFNKEGIVDFARQLHALGWELIASGGTAKVLLDAGLPVKDVAEMVGGGAILGHRVVTLSRELHASLLAAYTEADLAELKSLGLPTIDLVCVDLYPLCQEIENPQSTLQSVIDKTDIGGPTMMRSAAKGRRIVVSRAEDRQRVIDWLRNGEPEREMFISELVARAEMIIAEYCLLSARYHGEKIGGEKFAGMIGEKVLSCRYGENGWQLPVALYQTDESASDPLTLGKCIVVAGTAPSYNNLCDVDRMLQTLTHIAAVFDVNRGKVPLIAVAVKHGNPCGAAIGDSAQEVLKKTISGDTRAIFGGLVMTNFAIGAEEAETLLTYKMEKGHRLLDGIVAPEFSKKAIERLARKGDKCRFLANPALGNLTRASLDERVRMRYVRGGFLLQPNYTFVLDLEDEEMEKVGRASRALQNDLLLAWAIGSTSNSNTITLVRDSMLLADGVGQQDRVGACQLAIKRATDAGHSTEGSAAYSDSFFPFTDGPETLAKHGIKLIFATSGSVRDEDVKKACAENGVAIYLLPDSKARGFFGH